MMRTRWNEDWWSIAFGGPVGNVLTALIADLRWITPNGITWLSFVCKLVAAPLLLVGTTAADIGVVILFQAHTVLDCMDGTLARYRKKPSVMGAFLDKVTDMVGLVAIMTAIGWRSGNPYVLVVSLLIANVLLLRAYIFWVVANFEREHEVKKKTVGDRRPDFSTLTIGERAKKYLVSMWTVVHLAEADLYFWLSLGLLLDELRVTIYGLGIGIGILSMLIIGKRYWTILQLDRDKRTSSY
jgi:phosphatidylglycerophosphate synthase